MSQRLALTIVLAAALSIPTLLLAATFELDTALRRAGADRARGGAQNNTQMGGNWGRRGRRGRGSSNDARPSNSPAPQGSAAGGNWSSGVATDLSGVYEGLLKMGGGLELRGEVTLTITGDKFSFESDGKTYTGRVIANTTRGYTGATFFFDDLRDPATNTPLALSVRVRRTGDRLTFTPVRGARNRLFGDLGGNWNRP